MLDPCRGIGKDPSDPLAACSGMRNREDAKKRSIFQDIQLGTVKTRTAGGVHRLPPSQQDSGYRPQRLHRHLLRSRWSSPPHGQIGHTTFRGSCFSAVRSF